MELPFAFSTKLKFYVNGKKVGVLIVAFNKTATRALLLVRSFRILRDTKEVTT